MGSRHMCPTCSAAFSTKSHLRRHEISHLPYRPYNCHFCQQPFSRLDSARRHARACRSRGFQPVPQSQKRGKHRTSCDQCAAAKRACDKDIPCRSCRRDSLKCTYVRLEADAQSVKHQWSCDSPAQPRTERGILATQTNFVTPLNPAADNSVKTRIPFLLNYFKTDSTFFRRHSALKLGRSRSEEGLGVASELRHCDLSQLNLMAPSLFDDNSSCQFFQFLDNQLSPPSPISHSPLPNLQLEGLARRSAELIKMLTLVAGRTEATGRVQACFDAAISQDLFSTVNMTEFTQLYLEHFYRHCPIFHLPSFCLESVSLPLLLAIFMGGSIYSYPRDTYTLAIDCFDLVEEYIFSFPIFHKEYAGQGSMDRKISSLMEPFVAAIIMVQLQMGRNNAEVYRRIRTHRFPALVRVARSLSLFNIRRRTASSRSPFDNLTFLENECLIRVSTYLFLLDCQFIIGFRSPPLITIVELTGDLPGNEIDFLLDDTKMLARTITGDLDQCNLSIAEFEGLLMDNSWCGADNSQFRNISVFGLYAVLCGFLSIIFSAHATGTIQRQLQVIERALSRWKLIWDLLISQTPSEELERVGIMMSADEVWLLGKVFLRMDPKDFLEGLDSDSMEDIESLVNRMKKTVARSGR